MGVVDNITHDRFPKQGSHQFMRAEVLFHFDTGHRLFGVIVRDDAEAPWRTVIALADGRVVLADECQFRPIPDGEEVDRG
jgi:hypothetical protein